MSADPDSIPTDAELDALQAEIEKATSEQRSSRLEANTDMQAAMDKLREAGGVPDAPSGIEAAQARIVELETELATLKDRALRAMADAENTKKRAEREVAQSRAYGIERFAADTLGVYDNLQRALASVDDTARAELGDNAKTLLEGLELTEKNLMAVLARHGVKAVAGVGAKFDPNIHQAVAQVPSDQDKGHVAEVMQVGFTIADRTLRPAMVAVSTGPASK